jgi:hypothetical protein
MSVHETRNQDAGQPSPGARTPSASHPLEALYRAMGHQVWSRRGILWHSAGRFSLVTFPGNQRVSSTRQEIQQLLVETGKMAAVFCPQSGSGPEVTEYWLRRKDYGIHLLQRQFATHVRQHATRFVARELSWEEMAAGTRAIHADIAARRRVAIPELTDPRRWADLCRTASCIPGLRAFGCLADGEIAAYVVSWHDGDTCHGVLINRNSAFDRHRVGNVLLHAFSAAFIARLDTAAINLGRSWYPPVLSLDSFKRHAGYEEGKVALAVVLHPRYGRMLQSRWVAHAAALAGALTRGRVDLTGDVQVLEAARLTDIA